MAKFVGQQVTMIYMAKDGSLTKRQVKIERINEASVTGYCYLRKQLRTFRMDRILAIQPQRNMWRMSS
ncbi:WYL domain-containing protein [Terribacillus saccharophilus]|uniref:WYL domain-containing protein n=1 Tax=Terribacillus saccharophilus TaxID=361277 RepID=UPI002DCAD92F|nr:transcriptional regulator [Terribacillus saccharophilus]